MHLRPLGHLSKPGSSQRLAPHRGAEPARNHEPPGGERGSRTHGALADTPDFESGTFGHSVIYPRRNVAGARGSVNGLQRDRCNSNSASRTGSSIGHLDWPTRTPGAGKQGSNTTISPK